MAVLVGMRYDEMSIRFIHQSFCYATVRLGIAIEKRVAASLANHLTSKKVAEFSATGSGVPCPLIGRAVP
jgi:hypothetical protein